LRRRAALALALALPLAVAGACDSGGEPPAPRPEVKAYVGPKVEGGHHPFGLKWDWSQLDTLTPYLTDTAGGTTFYEFSWCEVEPAGDGKRDWSQIDTAVESATQLGYRIDLKIRVGSCWATGNDNPPRNQHRAASSLPKDLFRYGNFVSEAVTRYSKQGVGDFAFENEINARNFWRGSTKDYRRLMETAAHAAHDAAPDVRVFDAGLNSPAWGVIVAKSLLDDERDDDALAFYRRYFTRRQEQSGFLFPQVSSVSALERVLDDDPAGRVFDYFNVTRHLATSGVIDGLQLHYYDPWRELSSVVRVIHGALGERLPIEAWEVGIAWPGDDYTEAAQATETRRLFTSLLDSGVRRAIYLPVSFSPNRGREREVVRPLVDFATGAPNAAGREYARLVTEHRG
jgi:hypothetical protein